MKSIKRTFLMLAMILLFVGGAHGISFSIGEGNYYVSVGDYDYLPYAFVQQPGFAAPRINFTTMMSDYGTWVSVQPFGQVWQPYVSQGWRPYTYGHWINTEQYGPYWQGYEPWAWAGYHYGNWAYTPNMGWVWIPGYEWHPGRVAWAHGIDTIGWMPLPPTGYDYSRGYLTNVGPNNMFTYYDDDFGIAFGTGGYSYGGPYYDPRYRNSYYNNSFLNLTGLLFTFIDAAFFNDDNYSDYYLGPDYARYAFDQRVIRISSRPIEQTVLQRIVREPIRTVPVTVKTIQTDRQPIKVVVPASEESVQEIHRHANTVVRETIAPAFAKKNKAFKAERAKAQHAVNRIFHQENVQPKVRTVDANELVRHAEEQKRVHEQRSTQHREKAKAKVERVKREGKIKEPREKPAVGGKEQRRDEQSPVNRDQELKQEPAQQGTPTRREEVREEPAQQQQRPTRREEVREEPAQQKKTPTRKEEVREEPAQRRTPTRREEVTEEPAGEQKTIRKEDEKVTPEQKPTGREEIREEKEPAQPEQEMKPDKEGKQQQVDEKKQKAKKKQKDKDKDKDTEEKPPQE